MFIIWSHITLYRMKKLEEKANSTKQLAQQAELKRQLNRALGFHRKSLIIHYGFAPWIRFYERRRYSRYNTT